MIFISKKSTNFQENRNAWRILKECIYYHAGTVQFLAESSDGLLEKMLTLTLGEESNPVSNIHCIKFLSKVHTK